MKDYSSSESRRAVGTNREAHSKQCRKVLDHRHGGAGKLEQYCKNKEHWPLVSALLWSGLVIVTSIVYVAVYYLRH